MPSLCLPKYSHSYFPNPIIIIVFLFVLGLFSDTLIGCYNYSHSEFLSIFFEPLFVKYCLIISLILSSHKMWKGMCHIVFSPAQIIIFYILYWSCEYSVRQWPGRSGFNPRSSHTKDLKNGT